MIVPTCVLAILLVARVSAEGQVSPVEVSQAQPVPVHHIVSNQPESHHQVVGGPVAVEHQHQPHQVVHHQHQPQQPAHYSAPSGLIQLVGGEQQYASAGQQQQPILKHYSAAAGPAGVSPVSGQAGEQYGQPESASIPPNYKPFGSWGLYIGGNPADGYYSSYYKALGQSVSDKQQQQLQQVAPSSGGDSIKPVGVSQASGFAPGAQPLLKQAFSYQDQGYPYESSYYTPADLSSARVAVAPQPGSHFGPAVYNYVEQPSVSGGGLSYASSAFAAPEQYASTKRSSSSASSFGTKSRDIQAVPQAPVKGYQQQQQQQHGYYSYASVPAFAYQSPVEQQHHQQHQQVVAYPVPVGSQIVGSQPGVEGSFAPFGVHAFTRYAIKPTVVASAAPAPASVSQFPVYKQVVGYQQPLSFYGYPLSQLHYSQGSSLVGSQVDSGSSSPLSVGGGSVQPHPQAGVVGEQSFAAAAPSPFGYPAVEAASSDKSESTIEPKPATATGAAAAPVQPVNNKPTAATTK